MMTENKELLESLQALLSGTKHEISLLSNASAFIFGAFDRLNWAGFYLVRGGELILGPFQGKPACLVIPFGKGVCGTAAKEMRTVAVENVHEFAGHIACDGASNSELVVPLTVHGRLYGVLDIDSPVFSRFSKEDIENIEALARIISREIEISFQQTGDS